MIKNSRPSRRTIVDTLGNLSPDYRTELDRLAARMPSSPTTTELPPRKQLTNWQEEQKYQGRMETLRQNKARMISVNIDAIEAYEKYYSDKGYTPEHVAAVMARLKLGGRG